MEGRRGGGEGRVEGRGRGGGREEGRRRGEKGRGGREGDCSLIICTG